MALPTPKPPPPPLKNQDDAAAPASPADGNLTLPPSLALPTEDELRAEQNRQALLRQMAPPAAPDNPAGSIVSVVTAQEPPRPAAGSMADLRPPAAPASQPAPQTMAQTAAPAPPAAMAAAPAAPNPVPTTAPNPVPAEPTLESPPAPLVNPLGQRIIRRPPEPTLAEQLLPPSVQQAPAPQSTPQTAAAAAPAAPAGSPLPPETAAPAAPAPTRPRLDPSFNMLAGVEDEKGPRKRRPWLIVGAVSGSLAVVFGLLLWLQSSGTIYFGLLHRLVGGWPKEPTQALALLVSSQPSSYSLSGRISMIKAEQLPTVGEDSAAAAEMSGSARADYAGGNWVSSFTVQLADDYKVTSLQGESRLVDEQHYLYLDTLSLLKADNTWLKLKADDWSKTALSLPFAALNLSSLLSRASSGQYLGQNSLTAGDQTYNVAVYQYSLTSHGDYKDADYAEGRLLLWVDRRTGQIVNYQLDEMLTNEGLGSVVYQAVWEMDSASAITAPEVPTNETVESGTVHEIALDLGFISGSATSDLTTAAGRDQKRTADLLAIKEALQAYKLVEGTYPVSATVDKTRDSRALKTALVPDYLDSLPVDPQDPTKYYGYTSDGFSFKLTSIVEQSSTAGAVAGNGFYYQEIRN